jgi:hypothetical protein
LNKQITNGQKGWQPEMKKPKTVETSTHSKKRGVTEKPYE